MHGMHSLYSVPVKSLLANHQSTQLHGDTSPSPAKKPKSDDKQGNTSAAFRVQDFKAYFVDRRRVIYSRKQFVDSRRVIHSRKQFADKRELRM